MQRVVSKKSSIDGYGAVKSGSDEQPHLQQEGVPNSCYLLFPQQEGVSNEGSQFSLFAAPSNSSLSSTAPSAPEGLYSTATSAPVAHFIASEAALEAKESSGKEEKAENQIKSEIGALNRIEKNKTSLETFQRKITMATNKDGRLSTYTKYKYIRKTSEGVLNAGNATDELKITESSFSEYYINIFPKAKGGHFTVKRPGLPSEVAKDFFTVDADYNIRKFHSGADEKDVNNGYPKDGEFSLIGNEVSKFLCKILLLSFKVLALNFDQNKIIALIHKQIESFNPIDIPDDVSEDLYQNLALYLSTRRNELNMFREPRLYSLIISLQEKIQQRKNRKVNIEPGEIDPLLMEFIDNLSHISFEELNGFKFSN